MTHLILLINRMSLLRLRTLSDDELDGPPFSRIAIIADPARQFDEGLGSLLVILLKGLGEGESFAFGGGVEGGDAVAFRPLPLLEDLRPLRLAHY